MGQWEPLADRIPLDMRRLATQLRRMKDRSGLTLPALAARTAEPADAWAAYLAARRIPPLAAVEVLAQVSGADYDRVGALWKLAEKAAAGTGDRGRGKPVPRPDPLDPLSADDGLPAGRKRFVVLAAVGLFAVAALLAVVLTAGTSNGRAPAGDPGPSRQITAAATGSTAPSAPARGRTTAPAAGKAPDSGSASPAGGTASAPPPSAHPAVPLPPSAALTAVPPTGATVTAPPHTSAPAPAPTASATATPSATPSPTHTGLCIGLIVLGVCIG